MKLSLAAMLAAGCLTTGMLAKAAEPTAAFKDDLDRASYSIGMQIGASVKMQAQGQGLTLKPDMVAAGLKDVLSGGKPLLTEEQMRAALLALQQESKARMAEMGEKNKKAGEAFLAENKKKPGVKTLPSGLQYQVLKEGKGQKPTAADTVKANYKGTLIDGTEFDSSEKHGGPATFNLGGVIPGWTEALQLMPVGSKWRIFIPSELAYREQGAGGTIGPNSTLIFEVELLGIEKDTNPLN